MTTTGIICDVGGTLLLTDELHRDAWRQALRAQGLATDANIRRAYEGLSKGLDSFAIAESMGIEVDGARLLALTKQECAQVPMTSPPNAATIDWLHRQGDALLAAISHSDETWTRSMLQLAGVLERFAFVRGRNGALRVSKQALLSDAASILRDWWGVDGLVYCGDTELDRDVAHQLNLRYVDANSL